MSSHLPKVLDKALPKIIRVHVDNATSEGKNNTVAQLVSFLVHRHHFDQGPSLLLL